MLQALQTPKNYSSIDSRRLALTRRLRRDDGLDDEETASVLVIEDAPDIQRLMCIILESAGLNVTAASDGRAALELIDGWLAPDLVIMDRMLPYVSGDELLKRIRTDERWVDVPVVVVSAKARGRDVADSLGHGADAYITKPFNPKYFVEVVDRFI